MAKFIKWIGGRKVLFGFVSLILVVIFPYVKTEIVAIYITYCGGNGIVSLAWKK